MMSQKRDTDRITVTFCKEYIRIDRFYLFNAKIWTITRDNIFRVSADIFKV